MIYLLVLVGFLFFAGVAMTIGEGLWSNTILLLCVLISGIAGVVAGVPVGTMILKQVDRPDEQAWYFVFVGVWGVFSLVMLALRTMTDKASRSRVRFLPVVDKMGGILMALAVAVMLASFSAYTLLKIPIQAGEWKISEASAAQRGYFLKAASPFHTVIQRFVKAEEIDTSFYGK